jgi:hypothetical protein
VERRRARIRETQWRFVAGAAWWRRKREGGGGLVGRGCERSGAWRRHDTSAEEAGGGRCGATARSRDRGGGGTLACGTPTQ